MSNRPRTLVFGYSEVGYVCLELLIAHGVDIVGVFTHEDVSSNDGGFARLQNWPSDAHPAPCPKSLCVHPAIRDAWDSC